LLNEHFKKNVHKINENSDILKYQDFKFSPTSIHKHTEGSVLPRLFCQQINGNNRNETISGLAHSFYKKEPIGQTKNMDQIITLIPNIFERTLQNKFNLMN